MQTVSQRHGRDREAPPSAAKARQEHAQHAQGPDADPQNLLGNAALADRLPAGGSPIPFLAEMEALFGEDFGDVEAHFGEEDQMGAIGANAAAEGDVVAFATPNPDKGLVAHELAHVVQVRAHGEAAAGGVSSPSDGAEQQAEAVSAQVVAGEPAALAAPARPTAAVHRDETKAKPDPSTQPATETERKTARDAIRYWHRDQVAFATAMADFNSLNWNHYLSRTGGDAFLDWSDGQFQNVLINAVGTLAGAFAPAAIGAAIGSVIAPGVGTIIGAVVGFLVSTIWGAIAVAIGNDATNQMLHGAKKDQGDQVGAKIKDFAAERDQSVSNANKIEEKGLAVADDAANESFVVTRWTREMRAARDELQKPPRKSDLSLADAMLQEWVMQHAATPTEENDDTNGAAWDEAFVNAFYDDINETSVMGRADLFAKQARYAWGRLGLDTGPAGRMEEEIASQGLGADSAKKTYDHKVVAWTHADEVALGKAAVENSPIGKILPEEDQDQWRALLVMGSFEVASELDLEVSKNSCYADRFGYAVRLLEVPSSFDIPDTLSWTTSPD